MNPSHEPGTYVKGDQARVCSSTAEAVKASFDGFKRVDDVAVEVDAPDEQEVEVDSNALETTDPSELAPFDF